MITSENKEKLIKKFGTNDNDTGRCEVQIAILTSRIQHLTTHVEKHKKDHHTRRGLIMLVAKRRKLLDYLSRKDIQRYRQVLSDLSLRK